MLSNNQIKLIKSLTQKKYRQQLGLFVVEGVKGVQEFLNSRFELERLYVTKHVFNIPNDSIIEITETELRKISSLKSPNTALAVFKIPDAFPINLNGLIVALDDVRDPGNLGTIIRLCDWYGVTDLICSHQTVDCYNSKVVQATMGSLTRVNISYIDLNAFINDYDKTVYGTFMNGENIYNSKLTEKGIIILGNEANGISMTLEDKVNTRLAIPQFGENNTAESLNVANATAIVLSEFRRQSTET